MKTLRKGDRGEDVKTLQKALNLYADGIFGVLTEESVKAFQRENGLTADGIVGAKTWEKLNISSTAASTTPTGSLGLIKSKRSINEIIVHCTATREGQDFTVAQVRAMHKQRGWSDIGYHYLIYRDGSINVGRNVHISGAHCTNHNAHSIGVCYVGGLATDGKTAKDTRTAAQKTALVKLLMGLRALYPKATIHGHREYANKACPCFDAKTEYKSL